VTTHIPGAHQVFGYLSLLQLLSDCNIDFTSPASENVNQADVHLGETPIPQPFEPRMLKQVNMITEHTKYHIADSPLSKPLVKQSVLIIYTVKTSDLDEKSICGIVEILKCIVEEL